MEATLIELAKECPDVTISVKASDLLAFGRTIKNELLDELKNAKLETEELIKDDMLTREETMERFNISSATLWRWGQNGYLSPVKVGAQVRYRLSEINAMLAKRGGEL